MNGLWGYIGLVILTTALFLRRRFYMHLVRAAGSIVLIVYSCIIKDLPFFLLNLILCLADSINTWRFRKN